MRMMINGMRGSLARAANAGHPQSYNEQSERSVRDQVAARES